MGHFKNSNTFVSQTMPRILAAQSPNCPLILCDRGSDSADKWGGGLPKPALENQWLMVMKPYVAIYKFDCHENLEFDTFKDLIKH